MDPKVTRLVDGLWAESIGFLQDILSQPPHSLQLSQIDRAKAFLLQIRDSEKQSNKEKIDDLVDEFYR